MKSLLGYIFYYYLAVVHKTLIIQIINNSKQELFNTSNFIFALWHKNTFCPFFLYRNKNVAMFVSNNKKGDILNFVAKKLNYDTISLDSDHIKSTIHMTKKLKNGQNIVMAVDGPDGPAYQIKEGCKYLTEKTGVPTIALKLDYSLALPIFWRWDKYLLPLPFSKVKLTFSPIFAANSNWNYLSDYL